MSLLGKFDAKDRKIRDVVRSGRLDIDKFDVGLIGLPFDGSTRGRPGARFGPKAVRDKMFSYSTYCIDFDVDIGNLKIGDYGDINLGFGNVEQAKNVIKENLQKFFKNVKLGIVLGGDHSITEPSIGALSEVFEGKKIGLVVVDAHNDLRELEGGLVSSGTVMNDIISKYRNSVEPENIIQLGIRGFVNSEFYVKKARKLGVKIFTSMEIRKIGIEKIVSDIIVNLADEVDYIYFSFDVDGIDAVYAPGVNSPSIGGLTPFDVFYLAHSLGKNSKTVAMDVNEFAPAYDVANITGDLVANTILYFIAGFTLR